MHHICFETDALDEDVQRLKEKGYRFITEEPQIVPTSTWVIFIHPKSAGGVLIEFMSFTEGGCDDRFRCIETGRAKAKGYRAFNCGLCWFGAECRDAECRQVHAGWGHLCLLAT